MNTTANNRLEEILNSTPNTNRRKPKFKQQSPQNPGQSTDEGKLEDESESSRKIADQITERNARQVAAFVVENYINGTFAQKTLNEINALLQSRQKTADDSEDSRC